ncbi:c-type cytochrome, methanol metabolism-related [Inquilinus sp. Marseille-Q2685]|uniref:c-type cytochrome, methanol metabolism-related n=1 Tax=Inquilinus sp. Marseille-Q2685 TaxID=2866581 RepID=UPI001CE417E7|nr:c-type cytochrome, methanol metabolism-related [Inquilinus sp. Marseille-Q2685]
MPFRAFLFRTALLTGGLIAIGGFAAAGFAQDKSSDPAVQQPAANAPAAAAEGEEKPYKIAADGTVAWSVYNGFRRYNGICYVCHGPDGEGSSFAPSLVDSLKTLSFDQFMDTVVNGKETVNTASEKKMPALGTDPNVMCYINDIYAYLKARSDGAVGRGRPAKFEKKTKDYAEAEASCMGTPG